MKHEIRAISIAIVFTIYTRKMILEYIEFLVNLLRDTHPHITWHVYMFIRIVLLRFSLRVCVSVCIVAYLYIVRYTKYLNTYFPKSSKYILNTYYWHFLLYSRSRSFVAEFRLHSSTCKYPVQYAKLSLEIWLSWNLFNRKRNNVYLAKKAEISRRSSAKPIDTLVRIFVTQWRV